MAFKAGTVIIDVEPNTHGFYRKVKAMLERLDDQTIHLDADLDTMGVRRQVEQLEHSGGTIDFGVRINPRAFDKVHRELAEMASMAQFDVKADTKRFDKDLAASFDKMRQNHSNALKAMDTDAAREQRKQVAKLRELNEARGKVWGGKWTHMVEYRDNLAKIRSEIDKNVEAHNKLGAAVEKARVKRDSFKRNSDEYREASAEVKRLRGEYTALGNVIRKQEREAAKLAREHNSFLAKNAHDLDKVNQKISEQRKIVKDTTKSLLDEVNAESKLNQVRRVGNMLIDRNGLGYQRLERDLKRNTDMFRKASEQVSAHNDRQRELSKSLLKSEGNVDALRRTLGRLQFTDTSRFVKDLDAATKRVSMLQTELTKVRNNPRATVKFKAELDKGALQAELARLQRDVEVEVRVNAQQAAVERLEKELFELEHTRVNIPVDLKVNYENAIAERKRLIEQIRRNPELDWEVKSNVDIDEANARRELRDLQNDYQKLDMDVDLETALARAHLAYFTRPRTVDIFAKFHGTDLGKILGGMTTGATGIKGVQNQFQNLVNLFDRLDKVVPKVALVGTVLSDIGAGAINLAGTVGGLGKSIISMSKAAYAAPAALAGMGLAYSSLRMIIGEKGEAWTENINLAGTALEGLGEKLQDTFYGKAAPAFKDFANQVGNVVGPQMQRLASLEADVFNGMLNMVSASNKVGQVGRVFTHVNDSIKLLTPGVESVVRSFLDLSDVGGTYLAQFSNWISRNMEWFSTWARTVQADSSTVDRAMAQVKEQAGYLADSFFALKGVLRGVFEPLAQNQNGLERFAANLKKAESAVNSISFQDTMNAWARGAQNAQHGMRDAFGQIGDAANIMRNDVANVMTSFGQLTGNVFGNMTGLMSRVSPSFSRFADGVKDGFTSISGALKDAAPMFSQLVSMAGELSRTFGGTFAATLKAAAPMIEQVAKATESVAKAFNALPESVKGALGLWMTFGKAGTSALTALKTGMLENIQNTLQYRKTLADLGLSAGEAGISFGQLVKAQLAMRNGNIAGVLSQTGSNAAVMASNMGKAAGKTGGLVGGLKNVGSAVLGAFGGVPGLVGGAALAIGGGAIMTAISSYSQHVSDLKSVQAGFNEAMRATPGALAPTASSLDDLANRMDNFAVKTKEAFSQQRSFWDNINPSRTDFNTINDALGKIGVGVDDVAKATGAGRDEFEKYGRKLADISDTNMRKYLESSGDVAQSYKEQADAANTVFDKMNDLRKAMLDELKVKAVSVGKTADYVDQLDKQGQSVQSISAGLVTAEERMQTYASAQSKVSQMLREQRSAWTRAQAAGGSYYSTLEQMPSLLEQVRKEVEHGNSSWKGMADGFDLTTESGRSAADAMSTLASNANAYIDAMVARGDSWDTVNGKYSELRKNLEDTARQAGVAEGDVSAYVDTLLGTPESVKTRIEVQGLEQQSQMVSLIDSMQVLFPDGSRDQTRKFLLEAVANDTLDVDQLSKKLNELSDGKHEIVVSADGKQLTTVLTDAEGTLNELSGKAWETYLQARIKGKSDVDALNAALEDFPELKKAVAEAEAKGKDKVKALQDAILELKNKEVKVDAETGQADAKIDALKLTVKRFEDKPGMVQLDANTDPVLRKIAEVNGWHIDPKTGELWLDDTQYRQVLAITQGLQIEPKTGRLIAENNEYWQKLAETNGWTLDPKTGYLYANGDQAITVTQGVQEALSSVSDKAWTSYLAAIVRGKSEVDAIKEALESTPELKDAFVNAHEEGKPLIDALREAINSVPQTYTNRTAAYTSGKGDVDSMNTSIRRVPQRWNPTVRAAVYGRGETDGLREAIKSVTSKSVSVSASVSGLGAVQTLASSIGSVVSKTVDIIQRVTQVHAATGGRIHGPGTGTSDSIPAMLSNNEHVIRAASVAKLDRTVGPNFLNVLNRTGDVSKALANANNRYLDSAQNLARAAYATGGRVQSMFEKNATVVIDGGRTVNQTFNVQTKIVRSDQDLHAAAQIDRAALMRTARREARL